jgi:beta-glucosidase
VSRGYGDGAERIEQALEQLDLPRRVRLLTGADFWSVHADEAIGLRRMVVSDGPSGIRGETWDERSPSLNLPSATALAAAWDPDLAYRYGVAMAAEARRKGVDVVLGPTINLHRSPRNGRHFEAYSEDPLLTARIAVGFVRGLQDNGIGACPKHYVANDFETERLTASVEVSARALRELYLAPFEAVVAAGAWTVMSAYNAVGGVTMTENHLLASPLCDEWGFDGVVISDWFAARSLDAARARQDLVMPGPDGPWGDALVEAVRAGRIPAEAVAEKVRRLLRLAHRVGALASPDRDGATGAPEGTDVPAAAGSGPEAPGVGPAGVRLAREAEARAVVLVANDGILPLGDVATVAVIGQHAAEPRTQGGGSATVIPEATVSLLDGLRAARPGTRITHHLGAVADPGLQGLPPSALRVPGTDEPGVRVEFLGPDDVVVAEEIRRVTELVWLGNAPTGATRLAVTTDFRPAQAGAIESGAPAPGGNVELGVKGAGHAVVSVDGEVLIDGTPADGGDDHAAAVLDPPSLSARVELTGTSHRIGVVTDLPAGSAGACAVTLGWRPVVDDPDRLIADAAEAARAADVAVVVVGTSNKVESEGFDRTTLALPGRQDDLVRAVVAANPRTIVVVNSGSPVTMPWRDEPAAVLLSWFGGQEYGHALADVLTGAAEPGGRLPTTWPGDEADVPVIDVTPSEGVLHYREGIHIGYRAWQRAGTTPAYPFGFGLGYTTWAYGAATVEMLDDGTADVHVPVRNTGSRPGREVVQVYLSRPDSTIERPVRWLAGFTGVTAGPGEFAEAWVRIPRRAFEHWDEAAGGWALEPGPFVVEVGRHVDALEPAATVAPPAAVARH